MATNKEESEKIFFMEHLDPLSSFAVC